MGLRLPLSLESVPTSDCDLLDLFRFLIDPLLAADFLSGTHEFFEFLNLLSKNTGSQNAEIKGASGVPCPFATFWACTLQSSFLSPGVGTTLLHIFQPEA